MIYQVKIRLGSLPDGIVEVVQFYAPTREVLEAYLTSAYVAGTWEIIN